MGQKAAEPYVIKDVAGKLGQGFLRNPLTAVLGIVILALGWIALSTMPREEDPQIAISGGGIMVIMPGATPLEIENIISKPLEKKLREVRGIQHVYSTSMDSVGIVNVMYYIGENREDSNLKLYDKIMQNMDSMPKGVEQPLVKPFDIDIDVPIITLALYQTKDSKLSLVEFNEELRNLKHKVSSIDNVAKTTLHGSHKEQFNIEVDVNKLSAYHLSMGQIMTALQQLAVNVPDVKGRTKGNKLVFFGVSNAITSVKDIEGVRVTSYRDSPVYLRDVARVEQGIDKQKFQDVELIFRPNNDTSQALSPNIPQVTLSVSKLAGTNAVFVAQDVMKLIEEQKPLFKELGIEYRKTRDYGERANAAVDELMHHLVITIIIIAIMLVFALGWRESLIVTFSVPAILAITLFIAYMTGQTMNRITLFAFLLSLGLLVDAAIIVIENIHRHLHSPGVEDREMGELLVEATDEVGGPTNIATLAIIMTMVPMAFVGGMMGSFMKPIPYNVPVALFASLIVAYIFTPYLSLKLLKKPKHDECHDTEHNPYGICEICSDGTCPTCQDKKKEEK
ncbi:MAG: RND multidrug efflux transporter; Acriflavin resistance protein [uncultured Sulfurovum sp.]|uniref:RND multidrug efflux transporter Acriflavin resistance protein n=1 Tax=uncultured Sulfurovum sp. TaxID=269237 RepID=A0A6S6SB23_9BACT|nr:MAG: RND multidrug efflux transporter; Acriflavin resistance protein [uncultured Sulfurovum sp.]